ncbi:hypothetical protein V6N11_072121 [Hibiscus sabdariffa]|uniref:RNase H type-1 domain-containing protein n=1 Tax=Hibiscus sabdariffa TaxID=183260 RepID=A0ABR2U2U2_9ROSI
MGATVRSNVVGRSGNRQGVKWQKPEVGWWKLNSDGATAAGSDLCSCGGVVRDDDGKWLIGFARQLILEVNNTVVVDLIRNYNSDEPTFSLVPHIVALMNRSWQVETTHVLREGNELANSMAKLVCFDDFICHRVCLVADLDGEVGCCLFAVLLVVNLSGMLVAICYAVLLLCLLC